MVFFTCNGCGESLKKAQVEKHLGNCRSCQCLSCIDCGKDFWGSDYKTHLKCVTEDEKYGGKGFEAKAKKGEKKQAQWIQRIQEASKKPTISNDVRNIINQISAFDNVPKKKAKFQNWMKNSLKVSSPALQDKVWEIFEEAISNKNTNNNATETSNAPENEGKSEPSAATEESEKKSKRERKEERQKKNKKEKKDLNTEEQVQNNTKKKGKKRKMEDDEEAKDRGGKGKKKKKRNQEDEDASEEAEEETQSKKRNSEGEEAQENGADENGDEDSGKRGKFNWKGTIKALLKQAPDNELPIKKLRKKVIAQYYTISSEHHKSEEDLLATFSKKIQNNPKFRVLKERVKLVK